MSNKHISERYEFRESLKGEQINAAKVKSVNVKWKPTG